MSSRPAALISVIPLLFAATAAFGQAADNVVYTQCFNKQLEQLEDIKAACGVVGNQAASAAANPAVDSPDPGAGQGNALQCLRDSEAHLRKTAQRKCTEEARGQMLSNLQTTVATDDADPVAGATATGTTKCVATASKPCPPAQKVPIPRARPVVAAAKRPTTAVAKPETKAAPGTTDRNNKAAATSARNVTPQPAYTARNDAGSDVSLCESSYNNASRCCGNPSACVNELSYSEQQQYAQLNAMTNQAPPTTSQGLTDYCQQMQGLGGAGGGVNSSLAGICNSKQMSCSMVCSELANKYLSLISNCTGCESESIYQNAYAQLSSRSSNCDALAGRVSQISNQAIGAASSAGYGNLCNNVANSAPQGAPGSSVPPVGPSNGNLAGGNDRFAQNCTADPNTPACRALMNAAPTGTAQFGAADAADKKSKSDYNLPDDQSLTEKSFFSQAAEPQAVKTNPVANNSGGGIPGAGNETSARLGPDGNRQVSPGSPGYTTDILQGTQSSAGYSAPVQDNGPGPGRVQPALYTGAARNPASADDGGILGLDLRQFLPGGSRDPKRRLAGFGRRSEINAKEEDIWRIISSKMEEKCKLGVLMDCRY